MRRAKHQPVRTKIDLTDARQVRAWTKRLDINADELKAIINKVGDSVATVTREIELQRIDLRPPSADGSAGISRDQCVTTNASQIEH